MVYHTRHCMVYHIGYSQHLRANVNFLGVLEIFRIFELNHTFTFLIFQVFGLNIIGQNRFVNRGHFWIQTVYLSLEFHFEIPNLGLSGTVKHSPGTLGTNNSMEWMFCKLLPLTVCFYQRFAGCSSLKNISRALNCSRNRLTHAWRLSHLSWRLASKSLRILWFSIWKKINKLVGPLTTALRATTFSNQLPKFLELGHEISSFHLSHPTLQPYDALFYLHDHCPA